MDEIYPIKKLRRSLRCKSRSQTVDCKIEASCSQGFFAVLPLEIKFHIFSSLTIEDLSLLTITSKTLRSIVEQFLKSPSASPVCLERHHNLHSRVLTQAQREEYSTSFRHYGLLAKRSTCLYATKDRLKFALKGVQKFVCTPKTCAIPSQCIALYCFGKFLHTLIAGWDDRECIKLLEALTSETNMLKELKSLVVGKPGGKPETEFYIRLFFRRIFLDQCGVSIDKAFWLRHILKPFPMVHQARLLFLFYGPVIQDEVQWFEMCESAPFSREQVISCFNELSNAFKILHNHKYWSEDDIISVIEEITSLPDEWLAENVANLLYLCGEAITMKVLNSKAINGRMTELASCITSLSLVCVRHKQGFGWVMSLVCHVASLFDQQKQRMTFLFAVIDMFREIIVDIHEFDDETPHYMQQMTQAQAEFTKFLATLAFRGNQPQSQLSSIRAKLCATPASTEKAATNTEE